MQKTAAPGFGSRLTRSRYGPETPNSLARCRIVSVKETANAAFGSGDPDDDLVFDGQRRGGSGVVQSGIGDVFLP